MPLTDASDFGRGYWHLLLSVVVASLLAMHNVRAWAQAPRTTQRVIVLDEIRSVNGFAYNARIPLIHPNERDDRNTSIRLFEDDHELGPNRVKHVIIASDGGGTFSHWGDTMYFSASDNTDPRTNGRVYAVHFEDVPPHQDIVYQIDTGQIEPEKGHAWNVFLPLILRGWDDDSMRDNGSRLMLLENGWPLEEPHASHRAIRKQGLGRYSHWSGRVIFSTSDHTDPRTNGRQYAIALAPPPDHHVVDPATGTLPEIAESLPPIRIAFPSDGSLSGSARLEVVIENPDPSLLYYWEVDVDPEFDSPSLHRQPVLKIGSTGTNPFAANERDPNFDPKLTLPYRVGALAPLPHSLSWGSRSVEALASRLGYGLQGEQLLREIYGYVSSQFYRSPPQEYASSPELTLAMDKGLCGNVNALAVEILGSVGVAARLAKVQNPSLAPFIERGIGSHISAEVYLGGRWSIFDPWLEFDLPGVSFRDIHNGHPNGESIAAVTRSVTPDELKAVGAPIDAGTIRLRDYALDRVYYTNQFRNRVAGDNSEDEDRWFATEPRAMPDPPFDSLWPDDMLDVYVRVRGIKADRDSVRLFLSLPPSTPQPARVEATPWTTIKLTVDLRKAYGVHEALNADGQATVPNDP